MSLFGEKRRRFSQLEQLGWVGGNPSRALDLTGDVLQSVGFLTPQNALKTLPKMAEAVPWRCWNDRVFSWF